MFPLSMPSLFKSPRGCTWAASSFGVLIQARQGQWRAVPPKFEIFCVLYFCPFAFHLFTEVLQEFYFGAGSFQVMWSFCRHKVVHKTVRPCETQLELKSAFGPILPPIPAILAWNRKLSANEWRIGHDFNKGEDWQWKTRENRNSPWFVRE